MSQEKSKIPSVASKQVALENVETPETAAIELEIKSLTVQLASLPAGHPSIAIVNTRVAALTARLTYLPQF